MLKPVMWRNSKASVADEFVLPQRSLADTALAFTTKERVFYNEILQRSRNARPVLGPDGTVDKSSLKESLARLSGRCNIS